MGTTKKSGVMCFIDLENFKKATLTKQLRRLITRPHSLVAMVLEEKYFKRSNILETCIKGNAPSCGGVS